MCKYFEVVNGSVYALSVSVLGVFDGAIDTVDCPCFLSL